jgi:hypothetical protein
MALSDDLTRLATRAKEVETRYAAVREEARPRDVTLGHFRGWGHAAASATIASGHGARGRSGTSTACSLDSLP